MSTQEIARQTAEVDEKTAEVALSLFEHIEDQINRTDAKAQVVLAADALLLGWFGSQNLNVAQVLTDAHASMMLRATALLVVLILSGLFLSLVFGLIVILPLSRAPGRSSLLYFGGIARRGEAEFVAAFLGQSRLEVTRNVLASVHATAHIARQKFRWVTLSVAFLLVTLVLWGALEVTRVTLL